MLFTSSYKSNTLKLWGALFLSFTTLYFLMNWIPKLATNAGLSMELSIYAGMIFNMGAIVGIPIQGFLSLRFGLSKTIGILLFIKISFQINLEKYYVIIQNILIKYHLNL